LYAHFGNQGDQSKFKAAREFESVYNECMNVERQSNKNNIQWRDRLQREILRFNGKVLGPADGESISDATSDVRSSQKTGAAVKPKSALKHQQVSSAAA
jgi:hypothetical protein